MPAVATANPAPGFARKPDYRIALKPAGRRMRILLGCAVLAESDGALVMREGDYAPVYYFPRADVKLDAMTRTDHNTFCPFKGKASYWTAGGEENVAWSYEAPFDEMAEIRECVAFYGDKVEIRAE
jgi:uncharacterized protein (DUF427 family)